MKDGISHQEEDGRATDGTDDSDGNKDKQRLARGNEG
jgi:hypothetical protein